MGGMVCRVVLSVFLVSVAARAGAQPADPVSPRVPFPQIQDWNSLRIKLERLSCYGPCPVYSVEVRGNGDVLYQGKSGMILIAGTHRDRIPRTAVARLVRSFREADYFSLRERYASLDTDNPTYITSIAFDGRNKQVIDYIGRAVGMPEAAIRLENLIDEVAQTARWTQGSSDTAPSLLREHWNFRANTDDNDLLFSAAISHPDILSLYLERGFPPLDSPTLNLNPIVSASCRGNPALLQRLMLKRRRLPAIVLNAALSAAASMGDVPTMRFLIAHGATGARVSSDESTLDPLLSAVMSGKAAAVNEILKLHPDVKAYGVNDEGPIDVLLIRTPNQSENIQILSALIKAGANVETRGSYGCETPVFHAADAPNSVDVLHLLVQAGADVNARDDFGRTPLMTCFDVDYARALIALGADVLACDSQGRTALEVARQMGDQELAALLQNAMRSQKAPIPKVSFNK